MTLTFSIRERRTLLAALRCWQNELSYHSLDELRHYYSDLGHEPLTSAEVDALVQRLRGAR